MFLKYTGIINLDLVLKEEYNYCFDGDLVAFSEQPFVELEGIGKDALYWITVLDEKFLFKPLEDYSYNVWGELLSEEIAKKLGIPCAEYRLGELHNQKGVISKNVLNKDETLIVGSEIFQNFFNKIVYHNIAYESLLENRDFIKEYNIPSKFLGLNSYEQKRYTFNYLNNWKQVQAILKSDANFEHKEVSQVVLNLINMLLFDLITLQGDRHPNNWGIIKRDKHIYNCPLYDNLASFGLGFSNMKERVIKFQEEFINSLLLRDKQRIYSLIYQVRPNFTLSEDNVINVEKRIKDTTPKVLEDLMNKSDTGIQRKIINILLRAKEIDLDKIIRELEIKNGMKMNEDVHYYVVNIFELNISNLNDIIEKYWRRFSTNGTKKV